MGGEHFLSHEPEPTEFDVIVEGPPDRVFRISSVFLRRAAGRRVDARPVLSVILRDVLEHAAAEEDVRPFVVQVADTSRPPGLTRTPPSG